MPEFDAFDELSQKALSYFDHVETMQDAYDLLTEAAPRFPEQAALIYNWRFCAAAMLNKTDLALSLIQESLDAGFFWSADYLISDQDLKSLHGLPEFKRLLEISQEKYLEARKNSKPLVLSLPLPEKADDPMPLLLALHGNQLNAQYSVKYWESAVRGGWRTVLVQSSQVVTPFAFVWDDLELGAQEIKACYEELTSSDSAEIGLAAVGGFSKGGEMAIWLALNETIPLAGFIAVDPGGPTIRDPGKLLPLINLCKSKDRLRGWLVVGEKDPNVTHIKALHEMFISQSLECQLIISADISHDFPTDFDRILAEVLKALHSG